MSEAICFIRSAMRFWSSDDAVVVCCCTVGLVVFKLKGKGLGSL